jgi:cytoskeleton protein RodZ
MSDAATGTSDAGSKSAGTLLREARIAQGLHIAVMAASIKVSPRKLELLEADRYDELPDATFTRALAQTMCRVLKIAPEPVLSRLPQPRGIDLEHVASGINAPFREHPGRGEPRDWSVLSNPVLWGVALVIVATLVVLLLPQKWTARESAESSAPAASQASPTVPQATAVPQPAPAVAEVKVASAVLAPAPAVTAPVVAAPVAAPEPAVPAAPASAAARAGALQLRATAESWVQVSDGQGKVLVARTLQAGEALDLDGPTPLRVRVGNVSGTQISFRGKPVAMNAARDNTAKLELK